MSNDYSLFESFSKHGVWWLPSSPENRIRGNLVFNGDKIELELFGVFQGAESLVVERNFEVIFGSCGREDVTLLNCGLVQRRNINRESKTSSVGCHFALIGFHAMGGVAQEFSRAHIRYTGLEDWIGDTPITDNFEPDSSTPSGTLKVEHHIHERCDFDVPSINAKIGLTASRSQTGSAYKTILEHRAYVKIIPNLPSGLDWFLNIQHQLQRLLSFFADSSVQTITIRLFQVVIDQAHCPSACLICRLPQRQDNSDRLSRGMLIYLKDVESRLHGLLNSWYSNAERLKHVYNLYFAATQHQVIFADQEFLQLAQALEVFSRTTRVSKYISDEEYKELAEVLVRAIPKDTDCDLRQSLKSRIKFGNEFSLRKRIKAIFQDLEAETVELITSDVKRFINMVVDTRNYLVHLDESSSDNAIKDDEIYPVSNKLRLLLMALLMKELHFSETQTRQAMSRSTAYIRAEQSNDV